MGCASTVRDIPRPTCRSIRSPAHDGASRERRPGVGERLAVRAVVARRAPLAREQRLRRRGPPPPARCPAGPEPPATTAHQQRGRRPRRPPARHQAGTGSVGRSRWARRYSSTTKPTITTASVALPHCTTSHAQVGPPPDGAITSSVPRSAVDELAGDVPAVVTLVRQRDRGDVVADGALLHRVESVRPAVRPGEHDGEVVGAFRGLAVTQHGETDLGVVAGMDGGNRVERDHDPASRRRGRRHPDGETDDGGDERKQFPHTRPTPLPPTRFPPAPPECFRQPECYAPTRPAGNTPVDGNTRVREGGGAPGRTRRGAVRRA